MLRQKRMTSGRGIKESELDCERSERGFTGVRLSQLRGSYDAMSGAIPERSAKGKLNPITHFRSNPNPCAMAAMRELTLTMSEL